jgi:hypothetical protein
MNIARNYTFSWAMDATCALHILSIFQSLRITHSIDFSKLKDDTIMQDTALA